MNQNESKGNFFEKLSLTDMEKVHSSVIGWMLSDECDAFDIRERSFILTELFLGSSSCKKIFRRIESFIELNNIDIVYKTIDENGVKECWIIENKVKSSQHSDQLNTYLKNLREDSTCEYTDDDIHCVFLTLIEEKAKSEDKWVNRSYDDLKKIINNYSEGRNENVHSMILSEYVDAITHLVDVKNRFLINHISYPAVFTDGWKKKDRKSKELKENSEEITDDVLKRDREFISKSQLETIFQKLFLHNILINLNEKNKYLNSEKIKCNIDESRGNAQCCFYYNEGKKNTLGLVIGSDKEILSSKDFFNEFPIFDFSFQNGTFKIALSKAYNDLGRSQKNNIKEIESWTDAFNQAKLKYDYNRVNPGKSRARISISKKMTDESQKWYEQEMDTIVDRLNEEINSAFRIIGDIIRFHRHSPKY